MKIKIALSIMVVVTIALVSHVLFADEPEQKAAETHKTKLAQMRIALQTSKDYVEKSRAQFQQLKTSHDALRQQIKTARESLKNTVLTLKQTRQAARDAIGQARAAVRSAQITARSTPALAAATTLSTGIEATARDIESTLTSLETIAGNTDSLSATLGN